MSDYAFQVQIQDDAGSVCTQDLVLTVNPAFDCLGNPQSIGTAVFSLTASDACSFGNQIINGICGNWEVLRNTTTCITISYLEWSDTICNPGTAYTITVTLPYVSTGFYDALVPHTIQLQLEINAVTVDTDTGDLATDTPNPLVVTGNLPIGASNLVKIRVVLNAIPVPWIKIEDTGNLTVTPLTPT